MALKSSAELQEIVLTVLLKNSYWLSIVKNELNEASFSNMNYRLIYRALTHYYNRYSSMPDLKSLIVTIQDLHNDQYGDVNSVIEDLTRLWEAPVPENDDFISDKLTAFVRRVRTESALRKMLPYIQDGNKDVEIERVASEIVNAVSFSLAKSDVFVLADPEKIEEFRLKSIGTDSSPIVIRSCLEPINQALLFKGYKPGDLVMVVAAPGTGKTSFLTNEGSFAAIQGYNVLNVYLGDMTEYDGFIRYMACLSGEPQDKIASMNVQEQVEFAKVVNMSSNGALSRITVMAYAASQITVDQLIETILKAQEREKRHYDLIIVDYPDNLIRESTMMYESGGIVYNKLSLLAHTNKSVVLTASQPKITYWDKEIIPIEGAAESSQKQHVIDVMLTFGKVSRDANVGTIFMPKVRRGQTGRLIRVMTDWERCKITHIDEATYAKMKAQFV